MRDDSKTGPQHRGTEESKNFSPGIPPTEPTTALVSAFWRDIMKFAREPALYSLGHTNGVGTTLTPSVADGEKGLRRLLEATMLSRREQGDILPSLLARQCCEFYESLDLSHRKDFLRTLGRDFGKCLAHQVVASAQAYIDAVAAVCGTEIPTILPRAEETLRESLRPLYEKFFDQIRGLPGGMPFLITMRSNLLDILKQEGSDPHLRALNESLKSQLKQWFGIGSLDLERISWDTSASVLEKIVHYEAVHAVPTWQALKQRLGPGRLCYAFFHKGMPQEPLTFVQIALLKEVAGNVQDMLNNPHPEVIDPTVAIFYSISSSQKGLAGVDLGNFLIKRVVTELQTFLPTVSTFCTLSPIPGFRRWLTTALNQDVSELLTGEESTSIKRFAGEKKSSASSILSVGKRSYFLANRETQEVLRPILLRLCARYLVLEKRRSLALDPVGNFHIRNGACMHRLNWMGDSSAKGLAQSFGIMVNYNYILPLVEENNQAYLVDGSITLTNECVNAKPDDGPEMTALQWAVKQAPEAQRMDDRGVVRVRIGRDRVANL
ncbi:malonyl-CoA decarboxylase-domain-containing protein [Fimicolochytrium jonesii]|uniref:malonyl-CoA decarboxylase-domain-containing protein n=1 Tax=Fimicolochytrium jonesii TaxID=1396493 RepID=UPI0022FE361C|nr:malonyl-CoA decarboxylase-domain-containing protein [Fimicolochytrium jonesii]KAI8825007.1 malonyl-CoA decarboxylase-domain-containing protein [Fimicolochytrium jonesii]